VEQNRIDVLRSMLGQDPGNSFARYGLAMEFVKAGQYDAAVEQFVALLGKNPDYVAAYYHGGQALEKSGKLDEARAMYENGIAACVRTGDGHTRAEIETALAIL
jgi:tetratricopeptide (TPR) repeat protein